MGKLAYTALMKEQLVQHLSVMIAQMVFERKESLILESKPVSPEQMHMSLKLGRMGAAWVSTEDVEV